jgi:lysophospholipase L1-like esterase
MRGSPVPGLAVLAALVLMVPLVSAPQSPAGPDLLVSLGDSATVATGSCPALRCESRSWATGTDPSINSYYLRLRAAHPRAATGLLNAAEPGAHAADLPAQARRAVERKARFVTILIGANDACGRWMTPVDVFAWHIAEAMDILRRGLPRAKVVVVSIPDLYHLWKEGHGRPAAVVSWWIFGRLVCPSLLERPTSTSRADDRRRKNVAKRVDAYNSALADACEDYGKRCHWDGGKAHDLRFPLASVNRVDHFHPGLTGQQRLADATYPEDFLS